MRRAHVVGARSRVAFALGRELDGDTAVVLPAIGRADAPAARRGTVSTALATSSRRARRTWSSATTVAARSSARRARSPPVHGSTPTSGWSRCTARSPSADAEPVDWHAAVQLAQLALAHELVGVSRACLAMAREHALERIQFDQPIAKFQAVRHRLADTLVAIETAVAVLDAAWLDPTPGHRGDGQGHAPVAARAWPPSTASRCSPASASPPSTTCTATCGESGARPAVRLERASSPRQLGERAARDPHAPAAAPALDDLAWLPDMRGSATPNGDYFESIRARLARKAGSSNDCVSVAMARSSRFADRGVQGRVEQSLGLAHRLRRQLGDALRERERLLDRGAGGHDAVGDTDAHRVLGRQRGRRGGCTPWRAAGW